MKGLSLLLTITVLCFSIISTARCMDERDGIVQTNNKHKTSLAKSTSQIPTTVIHAAAVIKSSSIDSNIDLHLNDAITARRGSATGKPAIRNCQQHDQHDQEEVIPTTKKKEKNSEWISIKNALCERLIKQKDSIDQQITELKKAEKQESPNFITLSQKAKKVTKELNIQKRDLERTAIIYRKYNASNEEIVKLQEEWDITNHNITDVLDSRNNITELLIYNAHIKISEQEARIEERKNIKNLVDQQNDKEDKQKINRLLAVAESALDDYKKNFTKALEERVEFLKEIENSTLNNIDKRCITEEINTLKKEIAITNQKSETIDSIKLPTHIQNLDLGASIAWNRDIFDKKNKLKETESSNFIKRHFNLEKDKKKAIDACEKANVQYLKRAKKRKESGDAEGAKKDRESAAECRNEIDRINGNDPCAKKLITKENLHATAAKHKEAMARIRNQDNQITKPNNTIMPLKKEVAVPVSLNDSNNIENKGRGLLGWGTWIGL